MKGKILIGFLLAIISIGLVGFFAYKSLTRMVNTLNAEAQPNLKLLQLKELLVDISEAESSVRSYNITNDADDLDPYYKSLTTVDRKLDLLARTSEDDSLQSIWVDSIGLLIEDKFFVLNDLIELKNDSYREDVFQRVLENIEKIEDGTSPVFEMSEEEEQKETPAVAQLEQEDEQPEQKPEEEKKKKKKWGIFQKLFGSKKNKDEENEKDDEVEQGDEQDQVVALNDKSTEDDTANTLPTENESTANTSEDQTKDIKKELSEVVSQIKAEEMTSTRDLAQKELALYEQADQITRNLQYFVDKFEKQEAVLSKQRAKIAEETTQETTRRITLIALITLSIFIVLLFIIFHDISVNNRNKKKLQEAKNYAERLAKVKEEFLSNMSHEIRTPMNSIVGFAEQLTQTSLDNRQKTYIDTIKKSSEHLLVIINDVLDYSKLDSGKLHLEEIGFKPKECIKEVSEYLKSDAERKDLKFTNSVGKNVPEILMGDPVRFRQILINLVSNAIKFTDKGYVKIFCNAEIKSEKEIILEVKVRDSGIGIPKDKLNDIFTTFNQGDNSTTRKYGGTGLGLSICKKLIDLHNGHIHVESTPGKGSVFTFRIPYTVGSKKDLPSGDEYKKIETYFLKGTKVLIVDDEEYNLMLFSTILEKWGMKVKKATDGKEAIEILKDENFDLVLMDLQMPEMGGLEATEFIRDELKNDVPIMALTAASSREEAKKCVKAGMNDYIFKPVSEYDLYIKITGLLAVDKRIDEFRAIDEQVYSNITTNKNDGDAMQYDLEELIRLSSGDVDFVYNMLKLFIKNARVTLKEMKDAANEKDWNKVSLKAHKIVSPCRHLGLTDLVKNLKEIEISSKEGKTRKLPEKINLLEAGLDRLIQSLEKEVEKMSQKTI